VQVCDVVSATPKKCLKAPRCCDVTRPFFSQTMYADTVPKQNILKRPLGLLTTNIDFVPVSMQGQGDRAHDRFDPAPLQCRNELEDANWALYECHERGFRLG
jgi:hypothetical protein